MDLLRNNARWIMAVPYGGQLLFVAYEGDMSCYDPLFNEWKSKAPVPSLKHHFYAFIDNGKLVATVHDRNTADYAIFEYDAARNQWGNEKQQVMKNTIEQLIFV